MMLPYVGNGAYCYANSLSMSLLGAGANADELPGPGFLECLTTVLLGTCISPWKTGRWSSLAVPLSILMKGLHALYRRLAGLARFIAGRYQRRR
jgi:hypothetical protein